MSVEHDVSVEGLTTKHQIDVYWELKLAGVLHRVLVQAKNWNRRVSKGAVLTFKAVLDDIPGTVGIMVTAKGDQRGALEVATGYGIAICLLKEVEKKMALTLSVGDTVKLSIKGVLMAADKKPYGLAWQGDWLEPELSGWNIHWDGLWLKGEQIPEVRTPNIHLDFEKTELHGEDGARKGNLMQVYISMRQEVRAEFNKSGKAEGRHTHIFEGPTYVSAASLPKRIKVLNISADYLVKQRTVNWDVQLDNVAILSSKM